FWCTGNPLKSLEGLPEEIGGDFECFSDKTGTMGYVASFFEDGNQFLKSLKFNYFVSENKIRESRFLEACDELGVTAPEHIEGYIWV
ncbi:hypothetical protein EBU71_15205, partial [bacterium]|nr:hypothetical protein [Candidatus Elulimicrobium humile]